MNRTRRLLKRKLTHYVYRLEPRRRPSSRFVMPAILVGAALCLLLIVTYFVLHSSSSHAFSQGSKSTTAIQVTASKSGKRFGLALGDTLPELSTAQLNEELNTIASLGVGWIRIDMSWADVQPQNAQQYNWGSLDRVVAAATQRHIKILAILDYTPAWARPTDCATSQKCAPASDSQFATYATAAVRRYAPQGVQTWEIWNEPNLEGFWQPAPNPLAYTHLLQASYKAIKQIDPASTVITGGLGPLDDSATSIDQLSFLSDIYGDGAKPYFDAVGYHPYSYPALPSYVVSWNSWSTMADLPTSVRSIMAANGDSAKQVWITEYGAPTGGPGALATTTDSNFTAGPDHVSESLQAEMLAQATTQYKETPWMGGFFWYSYQDLGISTANSQNFFGLLRYDGSKKPAYYAMQEAVSSK
jgi:polysaccharide biosynthesis protein PslG